MVDLKWNMLRNDCLPFYPSRWSHSGGVNIDRNGYRRESSNGRERRSRSRVARRLNDNRIRVVLHDRDELRGRDRCHWRWSIGVDGRRRSSGVRYARWGPSTTKILLHAGLIEQTSSGCRDDLFDEPVRSRTPVVVHRLLNLGINSALK